MIWSFIRKAFKMKKRSNFWGADSEKNPGAQVFRGIACCISLKLSCLGMLIFLGAIIVLMIVGGTAGTVVSAIEKGLSRLGI